MTENVRHARPAPRPFYKEFWRGRKFGANGIETGVHKCFFGRTPSETKGHCSYFRVPGNGKYALTCGKSDRNGRKRATRKTYPWPFYKEFGRGRKFGPNGIDTGVHKFFLGALQRKPRASAVTLGSLAMGNML